MWYDRIHAYLQLIRMKEGKTKNTGNILRFARKITYQKSGGAITERTQGWLAIRSNKEDRSEEAGKGTTEGTPTRLPD